MGRQPIVLLVSGHRLAEMTTANSLVSYGYEVLFTRTLEEAGHLLCTHRRISVLVIDTDLGQAGDSLSLAKSARVSDPDGAIPNSSLTSIYTMAGIVLGSLAYLKLSALGWQWLTRLKHNRVVNPDGSGNS